MVEPAGTLGIVLQELAVRADVAGEEKPRRVPVRLGFDFDRGRAQKWPAFQKRMRTPCATCVQRLKALRETA